MQSLQWRGFHAFHVRCSICPAHKKHSRRSWQEWHITDIHMRTSLHTYVVSRWGFKTQVLVLFADSNQYRPYPNRLICYEWFPGRTLGEFLDDGRTSLNFLSLRSVALDIISGVEHLHKSRICHSSITLNSVLVTKCPRVRFNYGNRAEWLFVNHEYKYRPTSDVTKPTYQFIISITRIIRIIVRVWILDCVNQMSDYVQVPH